MGVSLAALHKYNEAIKYYDKALTIEPTLRNAIDGKHISLQALKNQTQIK
jgi:tetratricopeptide (TPR) repeat protein